MEEAQEQSRFLTCSGIQTSRATSVVLYVHPQSPSPTKSSQWTQILQSGPPNLLPLVPSTRRDKDWQTFVNATPECANVEPNQTFDCLREASVDTLIQALATFTQGNTELFPFSPVLDGNDGLIPDLPSRLLASGKFARIPLIAGTNLDDGQPISPLSSALRTDAYYA